MQTLPSPEYLVKIFDITSNPQGYTIIMKRYDQDLEKYLKQNPTLIQQNPSIGISIFLQILFGLVQLKFTHRDLKPSNILVDNNPNGFPKVVLADFGECNEGEIFNNQFYGTYNYMAPEIFFNQQIGSPKTTVPYTKKVDIWSAGIILYQLFTGFQKGKQKDHLVLPINCCLIKQKYKAFLFKRQSIIQNYLEQYSIIFKKSTPALIRQLINMMLKPSNMRPNILSILNFIRLHNIHNSICTTEQLSSFILKQQIQQLANNSKYYFLYKIKNIYNIYLLLFQQVSIDHIQHSSHKIKINYQQQYHILVLFMYFWIMIPFHEYQSYTHSKQSKPVTKETFQLLIFGDDNTNQSSKPINHYSSNMSNTDKLQTVKQNKQKLYISYHQIKNIINRSISKQALSNYNWKTFLTTESNKNDIQNLLTNQYRLHEQEVQYLFDYFQIAKEYPHL